MHERYKGAKYHRRPGMAWRAITLVVTCAFALGACGGDDDDDETSDEAGTAIYAVGDAADGGPSATELASYIEKQDLDRFFYLGDVYETGTAAEFERNYDRLYGDLADRTDPVIGNHEYLNRQRGYYAYWRRKRAWTEEQAKHRSYVDPDSGWQVIAYSSETDPASEARWVARQIDKQDGTCRIALAHRARYSIADSQHTDNVDQAPIWKVLAGTTAINLAAHSHVYGRLAPIDGVTVIVSGQGGHDIRALGPQQHQVEASAEGEPTVTRFMLRPGEAEMRQMGTDGKTYDDATIGCKRPE
jgi:calcineurin-like phosphoesterase family protein